MNPISRPLSSLVGALSEAWAEIRTHKLRVMLSLIGIAVAVGALTAVLALGDYQRQSMIEQSDLHGGRSAMLVVNATQSDGTAVDWEALDTHVQRSTSRFDFGHTARAVPYGAQSPVQFPDLVEQVPTRLFDLDYPTMHRLKLVEGRWFTEADTQSLAPPVVISEPMWERLGNPALSDHPTLRMTGNAAGVYPIIGVTPRTWSGDTEAQVTMLVDHFTGRIGPLPADAAVTWEFWTPPETVGEIAPVLAMDLRSGAPRGLDLSVSRSDWASQEDVMAQFDMMTLITSAIAGLVLALGGLNLLNVQLVAMRQRIREIGIRRSFGATGGRIFTAVMLESAVATTVAGIVGITIVVAVLRSPFVVLQLFQMQEVPPFPLTAAIGGLIGAVAVGALAGLIPALVALRVRVIDAIRY